MSSSKLYNRFNNFLEKILPKQVTSAKVRSYLKILFAFVATFAGFALLILGIGIIILLFAAGAMITLTLVMTRNIIVHKNNIGTEIGVLAGIIVQFCIG